LGEVGTGRAIGGSSQHNRHHKPFLQCFFASTTFFFGLIWLLFKQLPRTSNKTQLSSCYQSPKQFAIINIFNKTEKKLLKKIQQKKMRQKRQNGAGNQKKL